MSAEANQKKRILIGEDDALSRRLLEAFLLQAEGEPGQNGARPGGPEAGPHGRGDWETVPTGHSRRGLGA